jgi:hypothetical protein
MTHEQPPNDEAALARALGRWEGEGGALAREAGTRLVKGIPCFCPTSEGTTARSSALGVTRARSDCSGQRPGPVRDGPNGQAGWIVTVLPIAPAHRKCEDCRNPSDSWMQRQACLCIRIDARLVQFRVEHTMIDRFAGCIFAS